MSAPDSDENMRHFSSLPEACGKNPWVRYKTYLAAPTLLLFRRRESDANCCMTSLSCVHTASVWTPRETVRADVYPLLTLQTHPLPCAIHNNLTQPEHVVKLGRCVLVMIDSKVGVEDPSLFEVEEVSHWVYLGSICPDKEVEVNVIIPPRRSRGEWSKPRAWS